MEEKKNDRTLVFASSTELKAASTAGKSQCAFGGTDSRGATGVSDKILSRTIRVTKDKIKFAPEEFESLGILEDKYELIDKFAEGGQGILVTAMDIVLGRYVAIKSLKTDFLQDPQIISSFISEAKVTAQLDHPSIIPLYDLSSDSENGIHIAMKFIHGHTLQELIEDIILDCKQFGVKRSQAKEDESLKVRIEHFIKVCDAIGYAHRKGVLHRDLKPENIMVGSFHEVYVMDWGIAEVYQPQENSSPEEQTSKKGLSGTPGYIAPETVNTHAATVKSDQYALGMILFELATLKPGFIGQTIPEIFQNTVTGNIENVAHRFTNYSIPLDLKAIIRKATSLRPESRYADVNVLADDLRKFLMNEETVARPDNILRRTMRNLSKHRNITAIAIFAIILLCAGIAILSLLDQKRAIIESKRRELKFVNLQSSVENTAYQIDKRLMHISNVLERFSERVVGTLGNPSAGKNENIYSYLDFRDKSQPLAPGAAYSNFYRQNVSLSAASYKLSNGISYNDALPSLSALSPLVNDLFGYMADNEPFGSDMESARQKALATGLTIPWIYIGLEKGILVNYPGMGSLSEDYDVRQRPWYKNALGKTRTAWSSPYVDAFGLGVVISASRSLYDRGGRFFGVSSVDVTFDFAVSHILEKHKLQKAVKCGYLVDPEGNVVLSTKIKDAQVKEAEKTFATLKLGKFPWPEISGQIGERSSGQFEVNDAAGQKLLIAYAPVSTLCLFYVEEIYLSKFLGAESHE